MSERWESDDVDPSPLGQPLQFAFSSRTAPNRFMKGAMSEHLCSWSSTDINARGIPSANYVNLYRRWGEGQIGLMLTGNIQIDYEHIETMGNSIIARDAECEGERFEKFEEVAREAKKHGSLLVGQVNHPGRQVPDHIHNNPISASDVQLKGDAMGMTFAKPRAATLEDIQNIIQGFAHAAYYLEQAGFDGIELHGAHGYLLAQFLSQTTNKRTDQYGGSIANRTRIIVETAQAIRKVTSPSFILGIKLNSQEFQEGGLQVEEAAEVCKILDQNTFDFVELSGGTYEAVAFVHQRESTRKREAFFIEFAEKIVPSLTKTKVYITGGFKTAGGMAKALDTVDGIGLARPLCQEPRLCRDILSGKVKGAIKQRFDPNDVGGMTTVAGSLLKQISKDHEPLDLSREENLVIFMKDVEGWSKALRGSTEGDEVSLSADKDGQVYGFADLSCPVVAYGSVL